MLVPIALWSGNYYSPERRVRRASPGGGAAWMARGPESAIVNANQDIFEGAFVRELFDRMAGTYGIVNLVSSFGFTIFWRRACVGGVGRLAQGAQGYDLMSGMGETWDLLFRRNSVPFRLTAVDFSEGMVARSLRTRDRLGPDRIEVLRGDALSDLVRPDSADFITCCFGLKTLSPPQQADFARRVARALRSGGRCSFVEISDPRGWRLRPLFLFYLRRVIPLIGRLFLGDPDNYRMLGEYTVRFGDSRAFAEQLRQAGLAVELRRLFFGCATAVVGVKSATA